MLKLDKNTISEFEKAFVTKIKVFFYSAGCSGTKVDILIDNFEVDDSLEKIETSLSFDVYIEKQDREKFEGATITRVVKADHTGDSIARYIFSNEGVQERCGCGTSFAFEKKKPKFDFSKLKYLKKDFTK